MTFRLDLVKLCSRFFDIPENEKYDKLGILKEFENLKELFVKLVDKLTQSYLNAYNDDQFAKLDTKVFYIRGFFQAIDGIVAANGGMDLINERLTNKHFGINETDFRQTSREDCSQNQPADDFMHDPLAKSAFAFVDLKGKFDEKTFKSIPTIKHNYEKNEEPNLETQVTQTEIEFVTPLEYLEHFCALNLDEDVCIHVVSKEKDYSTTPREMLTMDCKTPIA